MPADRATVHENVVGEGEPWKTFATALAAMDAWQGIADLPCASVEISDP